jgi:hypothetical protein
MPGSPRLDPLQPCLARGAGAGIGSRVGSCGKLGECDCADAWSQVGVVAGHLRGDSATVQSFEIDDSRGVEQDVGAGS